VFILLYFRCIYSGRPHCNVYRH